jgi:hypothetical protein
MQKAKSRVALAFPDAQRLVFAQFAADDSQNRENYPAATSPTIVRALIHFAKGMPVRFDTLDYTRRKLVLRRSAIEHPFFWIGEIRETHACTHIEADCRLFYIDVKIVFLH